MNSFVSSFGVCLGIMIRKQWLKSVYHLGPHPFPRVGALCCHFWFFSTLASLSLSLAGEFGQLQPTDKLLSKGHERAWPCFHTRWPIPPLTSPLSPWHPVSYCGFHVCPLHPSFPFFSPFSHIQTHGGHSLVFCPSALPYQKGWPPLIWRSLIILCRTGGPLIQPLLPPASPSRPQHCPPPLSPMVLSSFSGCNCSTINRGGRRMGWGHGVRKKERQEGQNVIS